MEQNIKDNAHKYLSLKSEKLASAVYAITDFLSDNEPLKWRLRDKSLTLISDSVILKDLSLRDIADYDKIILSINELVALLEVGGVGGSVSRMNFDILKNEYLSLNELVQKKGANHPLDNYKIDEQTILHGLSSSETREPVPPSLNLIPSLRSTARQTYLNKYSENKPGDLYKGQKDTIKDNIRHVLKADSHLSKKESRQDQIVLFIKDKGWMSINEIAAAVSGYSLKTIQRELAALVEKGLLHKHGERRWSKYILV
ncbi:MAG: DeoR family transcriptional regulator [Patescibacteria group bacterium]